MKLVRDKIPFMFANGELEDRRIPEDSVFFQPTNSQFQVLLKLKIVEELGEVFSAPTERDEQQEMADLYEVLDSYCALRGWAQADIQTLRAAKRDRLGTFKEGWVLE